MKQYACIMFTFILLGTVFVALCGVNGYLYAAAFPWSTFLPKPACPAEHCTDPLPVDVCGAAGPCTVHVTHDYCQPGECAAEVCVARSASPIFVCPCTCVT